MVGQNHAVVLSRVGKVISQRNHSSKETPLEEELLVVVVQAALVAVVDQAALVAVVVQAAVVDQVALAVAAVQAALAAAVDQAVLADQLVMMGKVAKVVSKVLQLLGVVGTIRLQI